MASNRLSLYLLINTQLIVSMLTSYCRHYYIFCVRFIICTGGELNERIFNKVSALVCRTNAHFID